jgi:alpha-N-arabinofuranosidase
MSLLRHADRIGVACLAQLVNVIAPIRTEPDADAWRQSIFHPFALTARHARGEVLRVEPVGPPARDAEGVDAPAVDLAATRDPETGAMALFAVNRDETQPGRLELKLRDAHDLRVVEHVVIGGRDLLETNSKQKPDRVSPRPSTQNELDGATLILELPPVSWSMIRLAPRA